MHIRRQFENNCLQKLSNIDCKVVERKLNEVACMYLFQYFDNRLLRENRTSEIVEKLTNAIESLCSDISETN